jgi:hypothetical protein
MSYSPYPISPYYVELPRQQLRLMIKTTHLLYQLSQNPAYQTLLSGKLPSTAQLNHGHHAVMMGYDFHLTSSVPQLIEVNTNAGGCWFACLSHHPDAKNFPAVLGQKLLQTFITEYALFRQDLQARPRCLVILDEQPEQQFLYGEMQRFATLFQQAGIETLIAAPEALSLHSDGLYINQKKVDLIYNRHCDFYLQTEALSVVREAWLKAQLCLTPNPHTYGLLADKQRMILWSDAQLLTELGLNHQSIEFLKKTIPQTRLLESLPAEQAWATRKQWVFKPNTGYGSRGVYVGDKLTKAKFAEFNPQNTLIQQRVPPSLIKINDNVLFKTDFRLFVYRKRVLGVAARIYQGQVTNLRTENGGFAKVLLV